MAIFPQRRLRRLRANPAIRSMVRETEVRVTDFIYPMFAVTGTGIKKEIPSMPGCYHFSPDTLVEEVKEVQSLGIPAVMLFGVTETKDDVGTEAYHPRGIVPRAIKAIKRAIPDMVVVPDVCLCEYTSHGHCGIVENRQIVNDKTLELLCKSSLMYAQAGADIIAPSDMMDGRIAAIRKTLDENNFSQIPIMSYAAKYSSAFYGPFREAAGSKPQFGDRRSYQMDSPNVREALREIEEDIEEGADIVMVKPALAYLDVIQKARQTFNYPIAAYNVSGEYSMVKAAARNKWLDEKMVALEILTAIKRAGADIILTYHAKDAARWLK